MTSLLLLAHLEQLKFINFVEKPSLGKSALLENADLFFSLHNTKTNETVYVSEIASTLDWASFGAFTIPASERQHHIRLKTWLRYKEAQEKQNWHLSTDFVVDFGKLALLKLSLSEIDNDLFAKHTVIWTIDGQEYVIPDQVLDKSVAGIGERQWSVSRAKATKESYSFDDIRHVTNLYEGISELHLAKQRLPNQIEDLFKQSTTGTGFDPESVRSVKFSLHTLHRYISKQKNKNDTILSQIYRTRIAISNIISVLEEESASQQSVLKDRLAFVSSQIDPIYESLSTNIYPLTLSSFKRLGSIIADAFYIDLSESSGLMSIVGIELPNTTKDLVKNCIKDSHSTKNKPVSKFDLPTEVDRINGGLAYTVQLMISLMDLLDVPEIYPMEFRGSYSVIWDFTVESSDGKSGHSSADKIAYPLFYHEEHTEKFIVYNTMGKEVEFRNAKFEQGLHLLNKNLVVLLSATTDLYTQLHCNKKFDHQLSNNVPIECIDNLLWNLKYLLLFMTASD